MNYDEQKTITLKLRRCEKRNLIIFVFLNLRCFDVSNQRLIIIFFQRNLIF